MNDPQPETPAIPEDAQALAEAQAAKDREFLDELRERNKQRTIELTGSDGESLIDGEDIEELRELPPNRAQRRAMVANMKVMLASGPKQVPVRNATIIPRSKRRRRK